jgi:hypothetical protein
MSSRLKLWAARGALVLPIVVSVGLSLWFTRPVRMPPAPRQSTAFAAEPAEANSSEPVITVAGRTATAAAAADNDDNKNDTSLEARESLMRRRRIQLLSTQPSSTANESAVAEALLEEYAPHMWKRLQHMPADGPMRAKLQRQMMERARDLRRMQQRDPEQFKNEVEQFKLEDEVADLGRQLMRRAEPPPTGQEPLRTTLRETIAKLVDVRIRNREARLARLARTLENEKEKLEADRNNRDKLVQRQFDTVMNSRRPFGGPGGPGEGRPAFGAPNGPRRGAGTSRPGNESKTAVEASPTGSSHAASTPDDDENKSK